MTTRTRVTATRLYPGSFYPEEGPAIELTERASIPDVAALDDGNCFAIEVASSIEKLWTDGEGGEMWMNEKEIGSYRIYFGEKLSIADVEALTDSDYSILLTNMRGNNWDPICRTRRGNFQPLEPGDVVL